MHKHKALSLSQYFQDSQTKKAYPFKEKRIDAIVQASYSIQGNNLWELLNTNTPLTRVSHQHSSQFGQTVLSDAEANPAGRVNLTLPRDALKVDDETDGQSGRMVDEKSGLKINPASFTAMCLFGLCTTPSDGRADNYMVDHTGNIIGIDNDHCFAPLFRQDKTGQHLLNFRFVLFFLPQMHTPLDPTFCQHLQKSSLELLFLEWLRVLEEKNKEYHTLAQKGFILSELQNLQLPIQLTFPSFQRSYHTLQKAQAFIKTHPNSTHWELVTHLTPPHCHPLPKDFRRSRHTTPSPSPSF